MSFLTSHCVSTAMEMLFAVTRQIACKGKHRKNHRLFKPQQLWKIVFFWNLSLVCASCCHRFTYIDAIHATCMIRKKKTVYTFLKTDNVQILKQRRFGLKNHAKKYWELPNLFRSWQMFWIALNDGDSLHILCSNKVEDWGCKF